LLIFFTAAFFEISKGVKKGFIRSLISLGGIVFSALAATLVSPLTVEIISWIFNIKLNIGSQYGNLESSVNSVVEFFIGLLLAPFAVLLIFFLIRGLFSLIVGGICKKKLKPESESVQYSADDRSYIKRNDKTLAIITRAVSAFVLSVIITSPVMGTLSTAERAIGIIEKADKKNAQNIIPEGLDDVGTYSNDVVGNVFYQFGGKLFYNASSYGEYGGEKIYLYKELDVLEKTVEDFLYVQKAFQKPEEVTKKQISRLDELCTDIEQLKGVDQVLSDFISGMSSAWLNGESYFGIKKPIVGETVDNSFDDVLRACEITAAHSAKANAVTVIKIYAEILKSDIINLGSNDFETVLGCLNETGIIEKLNLILKENPYMNHISLSSMAVELVGERLKEYDYDAEKYEEFMTDMADAVNTVNGRGYGSSEERAKALSEYAMQYIEGYGIEISSNITDLIADELIRSFDGQFITSKDIAAKFEGYLN